MCRWWCCQVAKAAVLEDNVAVACKVVERLPQLAAHAANSGDPRLMQILQGNNWTLDREFPLCQNLLLLDAAQDNVIC